MGSHFPAYPCGMFFFPHVIEIPDTSFYLRSALQHKQHLRSWCTSHWCLSSLTTAWMLGDLIYPVWKYNLNIDCCTLKTLIHWPQSAMITEKIYDPSLLLQRKTGGKKHNMVNNEQKRERKRKAYTKEKLKKSTICNVFKNGLLLNALWI